MKDLFGYKIKVWREIKILKSVQTCQIITEILIFRQKIKLR